ncbi:hypothetical protein SUGI_0558610 [Cryptomeria japonica]|uniref:uncharacterized protein LOC131075594 n=1 Tax=Cryptomeria japonica TaxID=3369 RepID=UPI00240895B5|nr:uncharacterized protein LOC131075594 [Cryptomeria japonica]GLJ28384.1 hypothetical protein SUGI_0558610 [Cryptomeria japonica]
MEAAKKVPAAEVSEKQRGKSFYRRLKALSPIPYLAKARDYYVRSLTECAGRANYSGLAAGGPGVAMPASLPKSFSTSSSRNEEEFRELVRAASQRSNPYLSRSSSAQQQQDPFPRSFSSASTPPSVGRIDEDSPAYFPGSFKTSIPEADPRFPRSHSYSTAQNFHVRRGIAV